MLYDSRPAPSDIAAMQARTQRVTGTARKLLIGTCDDVQHILLRARDGKVFIVDPMDYRIVDASFSGVDTLIGLLNLECVREMMQQRRGSK
jgi:hypothetical protein